MRSHTRALPHRRSSRRPLERVGLVCLAAYALTIVLANWLIVHVGIVPVGFGLVAPAGVFAAGLAFTLRDLTQETLGRPAAVAAIALGALVSALVSPGLALASGAAFLCSELCDFVVYTPLRSRSFPLAVAASNTVGALVDSALFLWLAFGSIDLLAGQVVGKTESTLVALFLILVWRGRPARTAWERPTVAPDGRAS